MFNNMYQQKPCQTKPFERHSGDLLIVTFSLGLHQFEKLFFGKHVIFGLACVNGPFC